MLNVLRSFRKEEQEGLRVRKGARPPGERREGRQSHVQGVRDDCPERKRAHCPSNSFPKGGPLWGMCKVEEN